METVNVLPRGHGSVFQHEEKKIGEILTRIHEGYARAEQKGPYLVRGAIKIKLDDMLQDVSGSEEAVSGIRIAVDFVDLSRESMEQSFLAPFREMAEEK